MNSRCHRVRCQIYLGERVVANIACNVHSLTSPYKLYAIQRPISTNPVFDELIFHSETTPSDRVFFWLAQT